MNQPKMNRKIDVKAILSHIIRGDGINKCRICMGETKEGQVYLEDTVTMDGDKPVTLSEILETITGLQMEESRELPQGTCGLCIDNALLAWKFHRLCAESIWHWTKASEILPKVNFAVEDKAFYVFYNEEQNIKDQVVVNSIAKAVERLNMSKGFRKKRKKYKITRGLICQYCGKHFSSPQNLNEHIKNTMKRVCIKCLKIIDKSKLPRHLKRFHNKIVYPCHNCYKLFNSRSEVDQHKLTYHANKSCQCITCGCGFKNERSLRAHVYAHTLFNCSSCNLSFENRQCFRYHKTMCTSSKKTIQSIYECHDCGQKYYKKPSLKTHIVQKHLNILPYVCSVCGKRSSTLAHHKAHEAIHLTERLTYQCYCGAKMRTVLGFKMHQRIHSGEKPYECAECGERFLSASRRLDHIKRRHSSNVHHCCKKCGAKFIRPFELKKHYRNAHPEDPIEEEEFCPRGVCAECTTVAATAYEFRMLAQKSSTYWNNCLQSLSSLPAFHTKPMSLYGIIKDDLTFLTVNQFNGNASDLLDVLMNRLTKKKPVVATRKQRHPRSGPSCICTDCGKQFISPHYLNLHLKNSGQKEACWTCGAMVLRGKEMKEHLAKVHKTFMTVCSECPTLYPNDTELKKHIKKCHSHGALTCTDCGRTFQRTSSFEMHFQMHMVRTCRTCGAQFTSRTCYRQHRSKCEPNAKPDLKTIPRNRRSNIRDPATFICDYCGKIYHSRSQLKNHIIWIHMDIRPHQCQWCGKRFYTPARLAEHSVVHTRVRNFECDICGAKLVSKMAAVYHRRRHTGERPYECEECGEKFISSSRRSEHAKRRHNKGSRLQCKDCPATFVRNHELRKHMLKAHNEDHLKVDAKKESVNVNWTVLK